MCFNPHRRLTKRHNTNHFGGDGGWQRKGFHFILCASHVLPLASSSVCSDITISLLTPCLSLPLMHVSVRFCFLQTPFYMSEFISRHEFKGVKTNFVEQQFRKQLRFGFQNSRWNMISTYALYFCACDSHLWQLPVSEFPLNLLIQEQQICIRNFWERA